MRRIIVTVLLVALCLSSCYSPTAATSESWQLSNTLFQLNNMAVLPNGEMWAVGQDGTIIHDRVRISHLAEVFDYQGERGRFGYLSAIDFVSPDDGWITGSGGQIIHWDGKSWSTIMPFNLENRILLDIKFSSSEPGWAVGCYRNDTDTAIILRWNGTSWDEVTLPENIRKGFCFTNIDFSSSSTVWVTGENHQKDQSIVVVQRDEDWQIIPTDDEIKGFTAISATDTDLWTLTTENVSHWNGTYWQKIQLPEDFWFFHSENEFATPDILALSNEDVWIGGRQLLHWNGQELENLDYDEQYGWIVDIEADSSNTVWALTFTGNILQLSMP